jgi:hypothetical protein
MLAELPSPRNYYTKGKALFKKKTTLNKRKN